MRGSSASFALLACLALVGSAAAVRPSPQLAVTAHAAAGEEQPVGSWTRPWFCHGLDCPKYSVLNTTEAYETRAYKAGIWVSTDVEAYAYVLAAKTGFKRLFDYIGGANEKGMQIAMTAPVLIRISGAAGPFCKNNFTVSFYVPYEFQDSAPSPNNTDVYIQERESLTAFVAESGGFLWDDYSLSKMATGLTDALDAEGIAYDSDAFYFAGYDPPFRITGRHNEVWVLAAEEDGPEEAAA